jgi:hypothetical protein
MWNIHSGSKQPPEWEKIRDASHQRRPGCTNAAFDMEEIAEQALVAKNLKV